MNASLAGSAISLAGWLGDFYLLATLLLALVFIAFRWIRQPVRRLAVAWMATIELAVLAAVCALPGWPRISLVAASPRATSTVRSALTADAVRQTAETLPIVRPAAAIALPSDSPLPETPVSARRRWFVAPPSISALAGFGFFAGAGLTAFWLAWGAAAATRLRRRATAASPALRGQLAEIVRGARPPRLLLSRRVGNAAALGMMRPVILLPADLPRESPPKLLRAVLAHEWAHIRNRDLWLMGLARVLLVFLFAHPLFWRLRRRIRNDQDAVADAVAARENRPDYAAELLGWVRLTAGLSPLRVSTAAGLWESSSQLTRRIAMLLDETFRVHTATSRRWKLQAAGLLVALGVVFSLVTLQPRGSAAEPSCVAGAGAESQVKTYHAKLPPETRTSDVWIQLDADDKPLRGRFDYLGTEDGDKVVILSAGKGEVWFKNKHADSISPDFKNEGLKRIEAMRQTCDPSLALNGLEARKKAGKVKVEIKEPAKEGDFLTWTVTPTDARDRREIYELDPRTKRAERVTYLARVGGRWQQVRMIEELKQVDPKVFDIELPKDTLICDQIKRKPGVVRGKLSKEEVVEKLAREFFQALIAKDYDKVGLLYLGMPAARAKKELESLGCSKLIEIGEPVAGEYPNDFSVVVKAECGPRKWIAEYVPQVRLTDRETAAGEVREFFEALARQDEAAARRLLDAGLVFEGFRAKNSTKLKEFLEQYKVVRIVEIGSPAPRPGTDRLDVPVKVEVELPRSPRKDVTLWIRPAHNQPDRWAVVNATFRR
jgi:beta-lactamase regulating signal transducer with metallopeptidase domain